MTRLTTERALLTSPLLTRAQLEELDSATLADKVIGLRNDIADDAEEIARLRADLLAAHEERDAARSALDELVAAVRVEREAVAHLTRARHRSARAWDDGADAENEARQAHYEADDAMREATERLDALLSAAPPPATVPAALVRRQIGAVLAANGCDCDCGHSSDEHDDDCDRCLACRVEGALDAALAGCP